MKEIKITNMLEGAAIFESVASGNLTSKYGEVKSIRITQPDAYGEHKGYYTLTVNESNNYKEEGMNKTVRDAVIEFKGVACAGCFIEAIGIAPDIIPPRYIGQIVDGGLGFDGKYYRLVCTKSEFNTYVDSLSHHAGKELFQQYLAADKTLLEKEAKVDYTSCKLKWSGQDELIVCTSTNGETGCWVSGSEYIIKKSLKGDYVTDEFGRRRFVGEHVGALFTSTPQPKPVFTQEMSDNGELPSVGMECQTSTGMLTVKYVGKKVVVSEDSSDEEFMTSKKSALHSFKPLTPPIELIDGKAYQFMCEHKRGLGFYNERLNEFSSLNHTIDIEHCTNIKPLTVEVK